MQIGKVKPYTLYSGTSSLKLAASHLAKRGRKSQWQSKNAVLLNTVLP